MAAEIKPVPTTATTNSASNRANQKKPVLLHKVEGYDDAVNQAVLLPGEDGVIAVCNDRFELDSFFLVRQVNGLT